MILSSSCMLRCLGDGTIGISPFCVEGLKEGSYTFTLDDEYFRLVSESDFIDFRSAKPRLKSVRMPEEGLRLLPGSFVVCQTRETVNLSGAYSCLLSGRGSCAQVGLNVLQSSSFVEPGTDQKLRLEISNVGPHSVMIYPGMAVVKGIFISMSDVGSLSDAISNSSIEIVA